MSEYDEEIVYLDARGLRCPEPVMLLHQHMRKLGSGDMLDVLATDPSTQRYVPKFCTFLGHELLVHECLDEGVFHFRLRKGKDQP